MKKESNKKRMSSFFIILYLAIGSFFYFTYYILMTDYFKVNPFSFPYLILSVYFVFAIISFPYSGNKVSSWLEKKSVVGFFATPIISMPISYVLSPIIFIIGLL